MWRVAMSASNPRAHAEHEIAHELGPEPDEGQDRTLWAEECRGSIELLAGLADWNEALLRRVALEVAAEWSNQAVRALLLDAADAARNEQPRDASSSRRRKRH
jgi:hypothetical protein